jgi:hypothetical protein
LMIMRITAAVSLMWVGVEKWLYPWWSYSLLDNQLSAVRGTMNSHFFMYTAGWIEFCAAYALLFGRRGTQIAAWVLLIPMLTAITYFGTVDAVGHMPVILCLIILGITPTTMPAWAQTRTGHLFCFRRATACVLSAVAMLTVYRGLHAAVYVDPDQTQLAASLTLLSLVGLELAGLHGMRSLLRYYRNTARLHLQAR